MKKFFSAIVFWAALWGFEEATLGHLLHIASFNAGWLIWFPMSYFFMKTVYKKTDKLAAIALTSAAAAAIKTLDVFVTANLLIVVCPALSILFEGVSLSAVLKVLGPPMRKRLSSGVLAFVEPASCGILWRVLYAVGILAVPARIMPVYPYARAAALIDFVLLQGIVNAAFITVILIFGKSTYVNSMKEKISMQMRAGSLCFKPAASVLMLAAAVTAQLIL